MIDKLTPEQETQLTAYAQKMRKVALCTDRGDHNLAEEGLTVLWKDKGFSKPKFVWCDSPRQLLKKFKEDTGITETVDHLVAGQWQTYWVAFCKFPEDYLGIKYEPRETELLHAWEKVVNSVSCFLPYDEVCYICDRPEIININDRNVPDCENSPALKYRDGVCLWALNGIRVTEQIIMSPETLTVEQIVNEQNMELRRIMLERLGMHNFAAKADMKLVHEDTRTLNVPNLPKSESVSIEERLITGYVPSMEHARLLKCNNMNGLDEKPLTFAHVQDTSTNREYYLRVNPDAKRVYAAIGETFGMSEEEYLTTPYLRQGDVMLIPLSGDDRQQHS